MDLVLQYVKVTSELIILQYVDTAIIKKTDVLTAVFSIKFALNLDPWCGLLWITCPCRFLENKKIEMTQLNNTMQLNTQQIILT